MKRVFKELADLLLSPGRSSVTAFTGHRVRVQGVLPASVNISLLKIVSLCLVQRGVDYSAPLQESGSKGYCKASVFRASSVSRQTKASDIYEQ